MTKKEGWWNRRVSGGAKLLAGMFLVFELLLLAVLVFGMLNPELLRDVAMDFPEAGESAVEILRLAFPIVAGVVLFSLIGLILILANRAWGFILFAIPPGILILLSFVSGDFSGVPVLLISIGLLAFLLFFGPAHTPTDRSGRPRRHLIESTPSSANYRVNLPAADTIDQTLPPATETDSGLEEPRNRQ